MKVLLREYIVICLLYDTAYISPILDLILTFILDKVYNIVVIPISNRSLWNVRIHSVRKGQTIDHNYYIKNCLKPVINEVRNQEKSSRSKCIKLLHDNGRPHKHRDVIDYLTAEGIEIIPHPPYSPDLSPCDFWLNGYIKNNLSDQPNEESLTEAVCKIVQNIPEEEFRKTFDKLLERMKLCINNNGDYFEHLIK